MKKDVSNLVNCISYLFILFFIVSGNSLVFGCELCDRDLSQKDSKAAVLDVGDVQICHKYRGDVKNKENLREQDLIDFFAYKKSTLGPVHTIRFRSKLQGFTDRVISELVRLFPGVVRLDLSQQPLSFESLQIILDAYPDLHVLAVSLKSSNVKDLFSSRVPDLEHLFLFTQTPSNQALFEEVGKLSRLKTLKLPEIYQLDTIEVLSGLKQLTAVQTANFLTSKNKEFVKKVREELPSIQDLYLVNSPLLERAFK